MDKPPTNTVALLSGGVAGLVADIPLFPLDTIKTRLQSQQGFIKAGGFRWINSGIGPVVLGAFPNAALYLGAYELTKSVGSNYVSSSYTPVVLMIGASLGEITSCLIRVPVEVVKQCAQAGGRPSGLIFGETFQREGVRGFYRGYLSTVLREIPFSMIQLPLWDIMKSRWTEQQGKPIEAWQSSICGAVAAGIAGCLTTPLDVAKTRIMLAEHGSQTAKGNIPSVLKEIWRIEGTTKLFAGVVPRVLWISIGGAIFFGAYEKLKITLMNMHS